MVFAGVPHSPCCRCLPACSGRAHPLPRLQAHPDPAALAGRQCQDRHHLRLHPRPRARGGDAQARTQRDHCMHPYSDALPCCLPAALPATPTPHFHSFCRGPCTASPRFTAPPPCTAPACLPPCSTLRFACRAKRVVNNATVNEVLSDAAVLKRQAREIEDLRRILEGSECVPPCALPPPCLLQCFTAQSARLRRLCRLPAAPQRSLPCTTARPAPPHRTSPHHHPTQQPAHRGGD